jgi:hypothetical protein
MQSGEALQQRRTTRGQMNADKPTVALAWLLAHKAASRRPIHQAHNRVVPLLQKLGQFADVRPASIRESSHAQHQLMLLRRDTRGARRLFAEAQELTQLVAEPGEPPNQVRVRLWRRLLATRACIPEAFHV